MENDIVLINLIAVFTTCSSVITIFIGYEKYIMKRGEFRICRRVK